MAFAIIGLSFNLPGAKNTDQLVELLCSGKDALSHSGDNHPEEDNWVNRAGYITGDESFDYSLFGLSLRDSLIIEPQQRLFIQQAWKAIEIAGYNPKNIPHVTGVFSSSSDSQFNEFLHRSNVDLTRYEPYEIEVGANKEQQSLRTAFLFNFTGPAMGIQSACSSGLLTLHVAMQSLQNDDCELAVVGGSSLPYPAHKGYYYRSGMNLSERGKISSFDREADGMVPGFGAVVFVLKTYERAIEDKDTIYARIRGSAVNNDGRQKSSYTAPSTTAIARNISRALHKSGMARQNVDFVEAHGSGTVIGDVMEASALKMVFSEDEKQKPVAVSSIKAAVGHLDAAAGHAGLLKATLQVWQQRLFPAANFNELNENISLEKSALYIPKSLKRQTDLCGVVNSLGIGGTNCALVIDEPELKRVNRSETEEKLPVYMGADSPERLRHFLLQMREELASTDHSFRDICFTLARRASGKKCILQLYVEDKSSLVTQIGYALTDLKYESLTVSANKYSGQAVVLQSSELDEKQTISLSETSSSPKKISSESSLSQTLKSIWLENLMISDVKPEDSFTDLGGHSILVLSMLSDIQKQLNITLSLSWFDKHDKFSHQLEALTSLTAIRPGLNIIVPLRESTSPIRCRLVLIHASISGAERYQELANALPDDIDAIAVDSYNLYYPDKIQDINKLAELYAEKIVAAVVDKSIPHILGGWSLGGMLARVISARVAGKLNVVGNILLDSARFNEKYSSVFSPENTAYFMDVSTFVSEHSRQASSLSTLNNLYAIESNMVRNFHDPALLLPVLNVIATASIKPLDKPLLEKQFTLLKVNNGWDLGELVTNKYIDTDHEGLILATSVNKVSQLIKEFIDKYV